MALTLDPTLAPTQDSMERQPVIELIASQFLPAIPFDGSYYNMSTVEERDSNTITTSTDQIVSVAVRNDVDISFFYTDHDRTVWTEIHIPIGVNIENVTLVELPNEEIEIIYSTTNDLYHVITDFSGTVITSAESLISFAGDEYIRDPYVIKLANGNYFMTYIFENAGNIYIHTRTYTTSWSAASTITLTGLDITRPKANPSLVQITNGDIWLLFDYADELKDDGVTAITNIYQIISSDNGSTWTDPVKLTDYTDWGTVGKHPDLIERDDGTVTIAYTEEIAVLFADEDTVGWNEDDGAWCDGASSYGADIHYNPVTRMLYSYAINLYVGTKALCGIAVIDTENWEVVKTYSTQSSPAYNVLFKNEHVFPHKSESDGEYVVFFSAYAGAICVINDTTETITEYFLSDNEAYSLTKNIEIDFHGESYNAADNIWAVQVDADTDRLYIYFTCGYLYTPAVLVVYIDLTEPLDPSTGLYKVTEVFYSTSLLTAYEIGGLNVTTQPFLVVPEMNYLIFCNNGLSNWVGTLAVVDILSGGIVKQYRYATHPTFPRAGCDFPIYIDGHVYATFPYKTTYGQEEYRGLLDVNLETDAILYHRPSWATLDTYNLGSKVDTGDGRILIGVYDRGVAEYTISGETWKMFNNDTVLGFEPTGDYTIQSIAYDPTYNLIMVGSGHKLSSGHSGVRMFNEIGTFTRGQLIDAEYIIDTWEYAEPTDLNIGFTDFDNSITLDPGEDILWAVWTNRDVTEYSLKWDREVADKDLSDLIVADTAVVAEWSIDSTNKLSFTVSHGHLFDPHNILSTWSHFLKKGKKVSLRLGEIVDDVPYWQNQGTYVVDTIKISYGRGSYPVMSVTCESVDIIWDDVQVVATARYDAVYPENILIGLLTTIIDMDAGDIIIPDLENRHAIHYQWIDTDFKSIIVEILDHFGYIPYIDVDGKFTVKQITVGSSVDHTYTGAEIINFSPDDNYSSYTNKITIKGESLEFIEVVYPEELIEGVSGTGGWWENDDKKIDVYYSSDHQRKARNPRLEVITSIKDFEILWQESNGDEYISYVDTLDYYVQIKIEFPHLMGVLLGAIAALLVIGVMALSCGFGIPCGPFLMALSVACSVVSYILGQVATYEYEIYAQPIGEEKQIIYAEANDLPFQQELGGLVVNEEFTDPFCYTIQSCGVVAEQELDIVKAQRSRVSFDKLAHLQDEICDKLQVAHPYSGVPIDIFITNLKRSYKQPSRGVSNSGGVIDSITGWRL